MENLWNQTFHIEKEHERMMDYSARSWNRQLVRKYLLNYDEDRIIECMLIIHYKDQEEHDLTIELSNMYNCIVGCQFCASGNLKKSAIELNEEDYIAQINTCLKHSNINPDEYQNFYVSFYGIGEPSVVYDKIGHAMSIIKERYLHVQFNVATFGFDCTCFDFWKQISSAIRTLQIPYYSSERNLLKKIVRNLPEKYDFCYVLKKAMQYKEAYCHCRIKINYIVIRDHNDDDKEIENLIKILQPYLQSVCVRISFLNYTKVGRKNGYYSASSARLKEIYDKLTNAGVECYIFGTEKNIEVGCGQLLQDYISSGEVGKSNIL